MTTQNRTQEMDDHAAEFAAYMNAPWGRLRADMIEQHIAAHVPAGPLRVLDAGCGPGVLAARMGRAGHEVSGVDLSPGMLEQARAAVAAAGVDAEFKQGELHELDRAFPAGSFDLVLCHCVIEYVDDVPAALAGLRRMLAPGGRLSLLVSNSVARVFKAAVVSRDPAEALAVSARDDQPNSVFATQSRTFRLDQLLPLLDGAGLSVVETYGVRAFWDLLPRDGADVGGEFYDRMLELELAMSDRSPFRDVANYFHVIGAAEPVR
ncbi:class I SAM-dependent methyltransferase [Amycolatopsis sp. NPDC098790]|uniref:class I SAM-dependent methyltransferase n=1 Tax=Amycolatopsis sp. NPDC098790 TaxID=3363939 RepID=UPI0037FDB3D9